MASLTLDRVNKVYGDRYHAIHDLGLAVADGEFMVFVGPSGCGKSTALRMIAGLESVSSGEVRIGDRVVNAVDPKDRDIAMVFQSYALYPHKTVRENIAFPLRMAGLPRAEIEARVAAAARMLELADHLDRRPAQLSGGQRQRVAMGRAIVRRPQAFLMDEPLSNLDAKLRVQMRAEIARLQRALGVTTVYVTHDQVEAMTMGDRVAVMRAGRLQQVDSPQALYARPANAFVAAFIGSPSMNLFEAGLDGRRLHLGSQAIDLPDEVLAARPGLAARGGRRLIVGIRPEDIDDAAVTDRRRFAEVAAEVTLVEALGAETLLHLALDAPSVDAGAPGGAAGAGPGVPGTAVARASPRTRLRPGDRARLAVSAEALHFFDPETRASLW